MLRNEHPDKLLLRIALYQSQADEKTTEKQSIAGHTSMESWKVESEKQKAVASPMAEAIFINGFGLSRAYLRKPSQKECRLDFYLCATSSLARPN